MTLSIKKIIIRLNTGTGGINITDDENLNEKPKDNAKWYDVIAKKETVNYSLGRASSPQGAIEKLNGVLETYPEIYPEVNIGGDTFLIQKEDGKNIKKWDLKINLDTKLRVASLGNEIKIAS